MRRLVCAYLFPTMYADTRVGHADTHVGHRYFLGYFLNTSQTYLNIIHIF